MNLLARIVSVIAASVLLTGVSFHASETIKASDTPLSPPQLAQQYKAPCKVILDGEEIPCIAWENTYYVDVLKLCEGMKRVSGRVNADTLSLYADGNAQKLMLQEIGETLPGQLAPDCDAFLFKGERTEVWLPLDRLTGVLPVSILPDDENSVIYLSRVYDFSGIPEGKQLPVLMYHCVSDDIWGGEGLFMSPDSLRQQIQFLLDEGYQIIDFSDMSHLGDYDKPVIITFDDGYEDNYLNAFPIIQEFGIPVTVFMISSFFGRDLYLTDAEAKEMADSGLVSIQSHTSHHAHLTDEDDETIQQEASQSRLEIARVTGTVPNVLSYPTGRVDERVVNIVDDYYSLGVRTSDERWNSGSDLFGITRISMSRDITLEELQEKLNRLDEQDESGEIQQ